MHIIHSIDTSIMQLQLIEISSQVANEENNSGITTKLWHRMYFYYGHLTFK